LSTCLTQLNRHNRSSLDGRAMMLFLSLKTVSTSITVIEKRVRAADH